MGVFDHLVILQRMAFALLLGFTLVAFISTIYLSGRGHQSHYDGEGIEPVRDYGGWVKEGSGRVPIFLKLWIIAIVAWSLAFTGIVIHHGYWY
ncbi:MAG: hypothetical protein ACTHJX_00745 [Terriglobales bacterium]|jgi:hypothetical protein